MDALAYGAIPPLDDPTHVPAAEIDPAGPEPLAVIEAGGRIRAYPLSILIWHEAVNDSIGDVPVLVSYSPLTDSVTAWVRSAGEQVFSFAASGKVYAATGLLADRETGSLWLPPFGRAVAGSSKGLSLAGLPVAVVPASVYREAVPDGTVVSPETGFTRPYGRSPYAGYLSRAEPPRRLFLREPDARLIPKAHVLAVPGDPVYPFEAVRAAGSVNDGGVAVFWIERVASALDREVIAGARDTGSAVAYLSTLDGRRLTFDRMPGEPLRFRDAQTGTIWNALGHGIEGPLRGRRLRPLAAVRSFWFAWAALDPPARVYGGGGEG
ncbi:MAG TPA: DUF3179 domain-containing protein [Actinomycetota bacterium]|nr:DUF3179 domain-containing protein [Actinomycetota bacterium]